jgi:HPt (histidine-containing phosphotransfer) domain-containing protein
MEGSFSSTPESKTRMNIENLFEEKNRLLVAFLQVTQDYHARFTNSAAPGTTVEQKMDWVDELSDLREAHVKTLQALDQQIEQAKTQLNRSTIEILQGSPVFKHSLSETLRLIKEIQLTDQSLFLYIQNMGFELRAQILKSLKEKEAVSKFKSQSQSTTGEGLDQTI